LTIVALLSIVGFTESVSVLAPLPFMHFALVGGEAQAGAASQWIDRSLAIVGLTPSIGSLL
jgi:hypothetical protein